MKTTLVLLALFGMTLSTASQGDIVGEAYNSDDHQDVVAVTYGIASDGGNNLADTQGYRVPSMVERLPDVIKPPAPGPLESIDEVPSETTYYDGSLNLNVAQIDCHIISIPNDCYKQTVCGWCGENSSCIRGTAMTNMEPCQGGYQYATGFMKR